MSNPAGPDFRWIATGDAAFAAAVEGIDAAIRTVDFEVYIYADSDPGRAIRDALARAAQRGVRVRVLLDSFGSFNLANSFWDTVRRAGGDVRWFNPLTLHRFNIRNHRKLLVCDGHTAYVGGFNVAQEWVGDGVSHGWRDLGLIVRGPLATALQQSFVGMFGRADFRHSVLARLRRSVSRHHIVTPQGELILTGPGRGRHPIRKALQQELARTRDLRVIAAYFLPPPRLRRAMERVARRGGRVRVILPAHSDVPLMQAATRGLYERLLRTGVEILEYQPQILHTKFILADDALFVGSANLDPRSLGINYDFLVRVESAALAAEARDHFAEHERNSRPIDPVTWRRQRSLWAKLRERLALFLFLRIDPLITRHQVRNFR